MDDVEGMSWGRWRPSPGSIYPLLEEMVKDGLVTKRPDGKYEITEKGKSEGEFPFGFPFGDHAHGVDQMIAEINGYVSYFEDLSRSDKAKLMPFQPTIKELSSRLSRLSE